jgi:hypothetical protein
MCSAQCTVALLHCPCLTPLDSSHDSLPLTSMWRSAFTSQSAPTDKLTSNIKTSRKLVWAVQNIWLGSYSVVPFRRANSHQLGPLSLRRTQSSLSKRCPWKRKVFKRVTSNPSGYSRSQSCKWNGCQRETDELSTAPCTGVASGWTYHNIVNQSTTGTCDQIHVPAALPTGTDPLDRMLRGTHSRIG